MEHDYLKKLQQHPTWQLLRADNAPLIISFFYRVFIAPNNRSLRQSEITEKLTDMLHHLRQIHGDKLYPKTAAAYLNDWTSGEQAFLRKYLPAQGDEPAYDSYSQGCFRNGSKHLDGKFQKTINEHVVVDVFYMQDQFSSQNKTLVAQQVGTGVAAKIGTSFSVAGTYSLARTIAESKANNQLFQIAINHHKKMRKGSVTQQLRGGKVFVLIADTLQQITQMSHQLLITNGKLKVGVISTYEKYNGINRLYGQNIIVQPTLGFHSKLLQADMSYSFMKSQQFGMDRGMLLNIIISPAPNFYWKISGQRWLKKELIYFIENVDPLVKPWYLTISMNLKLK